MSFDYEDRRRSLELANDPQQTRQLVGDVYDFLSNPEYEQAVQDAVIAAGVPQRLRTSRGDQQQQPCHNSIAGQHPRATAGTLSSAQSTISLCTPANQPQQTVRPGTTAAAAAKGVSASSAGARQQDPMVSELKQEVESLLQRTDSILSRSSNNSTRHGASGAHLQGLTINTASSSPHGYNPLQELGGFDFETGSTTLETPTFSKSGGGRDAGSSSSFTRRLTGDGGRRRTTFNPEGSVPRGQRLSVSSLTPPIGSSSNGTGVPVPDFVVQLGIVQEEGGGGSSAGAGARQEFSLASRLSQQALSELKDRLDSAETLSRFSSGFSGADQTTVVLDKSASWRQRAGGAAAAGKGSFRGGGEGGAAAGAGGGSGGSSIYANFAPLEQLVDAALTESAPGTGGPGSWRVSGASNQMGLLGPGVVPTIGQAGGRTSGQLSRAPSTHTSHKVALGYMLQPDYIHNTTLSRLKSELQGLSKPPAAGVLGGGNFDVQLLALTARLSQWAQQERTAGETFQQLLDSILDGVFGRLSPSRGRLPPPSATAAQSQPQPLPPAQTQHLQAATRSVGHQAVGNASKPDGSSSPHPGSSLTKAGSSGPSTGGWGGGSSMAAAAADAARRMSQAGSRRNTRNDGSSAAAADSPAAAAAAATKPTESMLRSAFAKLALGQAKLRRAVGAAGAPPSKETADAKPTPTAAAAAGVLVAQPDIGVAACFSCSSSGSGSRQQSQQREVLDAAAVAQIQAAMQAAAAAAAAAGGGTAAAAAADGLQGMQDQVNVYEQRAAVLPHPYQSVQATRQPVGFRTTTSTMGSASPSHPPYSSMVGPASSTAAAAANSTSQRPYLPSNPHTAAAVGSVGTGAGGHSASFCSPSGKAARHSSGLQGSGSCSCSPHCCQATGPQQALLGYNSDQQTSCGPHTAPQQWQQQRSSSTGSWSQSQYQPPQQQQHSHGRLGAAVQGWSPGPPSMLGHGHSSSTDRFASPGRGQPQPWLSQLHHQHPQQQRQLQCNNMPLPTAAVAGPADAAAAGQDAWPSGKMPSRWSPGRDTLALARQAHKQRTITEALSPGAWSLSPAAAAAGGAGGWRQWGSFSAPGFQQAQQQPQQQDASPPTDTFGGTQRRLFAGLQQQQQESSWLPPPHHNAALPNARCESLPTAGMSQLTAGGGQCVRVSTAAAAAGPYGPGDMNWATAGLSQCRGTFSSSSYSPRCARLPLAGGCTVDVFADAVEVHSRHGSPMKIDVLPSCSDGGPCP